MNIKKIYFGLVSFVSIIAISISLGVILTSLGKKFFISDKEYLVNNNWEINDCKFSLQRKFCGSYGKDYNKCIFNLENDSKYKLDLENCKKEKEDKILTKRNYNFKISLIGSFSTMIVFAILFIFHYGRFKKLD